MTRFIVILALLTASQGLIGQNITHAYDSVLAAKLGADDYGMKNYTFVILQTGDSVVGDAERRGKLFQGHFDNMKQLAEAGNLIVAGPFGSNDLSYRGLFILNTKSAEQAMEWLMNDPAIRTGIFKPILIPWYGSAALPAYLDTHKKIEKKGF